MKVIDNVNQRLVDDLKESIKPGTSISVVAESFSIYAFEALKKQLGQIDELRFIYTKPTFVEEELKPEVPQFYIPHVIKEANLCGGEFELRLKNKLNQRALTKACSNWVKEKVTFKSNTLAQAHIPAMIHVDNGAHDLHGATTEEQVTYTGMASFDSTSLGLTAAQGFPTLIHRTAGTSSQSYVDYFNQIWNKPEHLSDVTEKVQQYFNMAFQDNSPEFIYFVTLYHLFHEFLDEQSGDNLPNEALGFKDSKIWNMLYDFQKDAVVGGINKLEKYNGCIIADSVGLGKTFTALGIIKYYLCRNKDVLVLCPKKLEENWNTYRYNDKANILASDRLNYDVLFHTDLSRDSGYSNGRNLDQVNWGNYGLVVIDESHNFRNNNKNAGKENRYQKLIRKICQEGIETKVLMLSATPVNNKFNDLKNQLALIYEDDECIINAKLETTSGIKTIFMRAQKAFTVWSKYDSDDRTSEALLDMLDFDFFEVLDALTIARSRKHITRYYDTAAIGKFPERTAPVSIECPLTENGSITFTDIAEKLSQLNLSIYSPLSYVLPSKQGFYAKLYDQKVSTGVLSQQDRERSLKTLMRINLLKRVESSVDSFRITLGGIIDQIETAVTAIEQMQDVDDVSGVEALLNSDNFEWEAGWGDEEQLVGKKVKVHLADVDTTMWLEDLTEDLQLLNDLWSQVVDVSGEQDAKLQRLKSLMVNKINQPFNPENKKLIVFTAFADTAQYLFKELKGHLLSEFGIHSALITGSDKQTTDKSIKADMNMILGCFSPRSKEKDKRYPDLDAKVDVLFATDCISEGQNLQDCDYLINYDIHWNPVRMIQRFGRIDRIGSINTSITMVNFWPDVTLDAYINLKQKVESKMLITNMTATADDNILNDDERDLEYRKTQLKKLKEEVIDLEDLKEGISITDLGLSDFRTDLIQLVKKYESPNRLPKGLHTVVNATENFEPGVVFVLKNINHSANIKQLNRLHPYYLVYMSRSGEVLIRHIDAKKILDAIRFMSYGIEQPIQELCQLLSKETKDYQNMTSYSSLLKEAITTVLETNEEKEILSLFKAGGTTALHDGLKGMEDFSLISFFVVK